MRIQQKFDDVSLDCNGTLEVPVINRVYEDKMLRKKAIALGFPYQKWRWPSHENLESYDTENRDILDPAISDRIVGHESFTQSGQLSDGSNFF